MDPDRTGRKIVMDIRTPIVISVFLAAFSMFCVETPAQAKPCGCAHARMLMSYLNEVDITMQELRAKWDTPWPVEASNGPAYKDADWEELFDTIKDLQRSVQLVDAEAQQAYLDPYTCKIERSSADACIKSIQQPYFDYIFRECNPRRNIKVPYYKSLTLKQFELIQLKAYDDSRNAILAALRSLPANCRPNNWFGYVVLQRVKTSSAVTKFLATTGITKPSAGISISNGGNETAGSKFNYLGTIYVSDGKSENSRGYAAYTMESSKVISGRVYCSPKRPDETVVQTSGKSEQLEGVLYGKASFRFSVDAAGNYGMNMTFYPVPFTGQMKTIGTTAGCDGKPTSFTNPLSSRSDAPAPFSVRGKIDMASPDLIEGNKVEHPPAGNSSLTSANTTMIFSEEINVRWTLRRIPNR